MRHATQTVSQCLSDHARLSANFGTRHHNIKNSIRIGAVCLLRACSTASAWACSLGLCRSFECSLGEPSDPAHHHYEAVTLRLLSE